MILSFPANGFSKHHINIDICADWLEASALFSAEGYVSGGDVVDVLLEAGFYGSQDLAWELISDCFNHVTLRSQLIGANYPFMLHNKTRLMRKDTWVHYAPYTFCLVLSLSGAYPKWWRSFGNDYTEQGQLFERLTAEAMSAHLAGWTVKLTGWSKTSPRKLAPVVSDVSSWLSEATGALHPWTKKDANEAGLDIVCYRRYVDSRGGYPTMLVQCASGKDWESKLRTPDLRIWTKVISFCTEPKKAFSMPFAISTSDFQRNCNIVNGLLMDRLRLLAPGHSVDVWVSLETAKALKKWIRPRLKSLPVLAMADVL